MTVPLSKALPSEAAAPTASSSPCGAPTFFTDDVERVEEVKKAGDPPSKDSPPVVSREPGRLPYRLPKAPPETVSGFCAVREHPPPSIPCDSL